MERAPPRQGAFLGVLANYSDRKTQGGVLLTAVLDQNQLLLAYEKERTNIMTGPAEVIKLLDNDIDVHCFALKCSNGS